MKISVLILILLITVNVFAVQVLSEHARLYILNEETLKEFDMEEITTVRQKNDEEQKDLWSGVRLKVVMQKYGLTNSESLEFLAHDKYLIRLNQDEIAKYNPLIAFERNGKKLDESKIRLISEEMPEMYWIANLHRITPIKEIVITEPVNIYPYHTIINRIRLHDNPKPFVNVKGYKLNDIVTYFTRTSDIYIRLVSKDGLEQILPYSTYFNDAYLIVDNDKFSIHAPDMPTGMWQKDIMLIDVNGNNVFFYKDIDKENNQSYKNFIELINGKERKAYYLDYSHIITNWKDLKWEELQYIQ